MMRRLIALVIAALLTWGPPAAFAKWHSVLQVAVGGGGGGGLSVKQTAHNSIIGGFATTITATFGSPVSAGSIIAVAAMWNGGNTTTGTFTDGSGDTATDSGAGQLTDNNNNNSQVVAFLSPTAGTTTVTLTITANEANFHIVAWEVAGYTGSVTFDQVAHANGLNTNTATTGALAQAAEFGLVYAENSNTSFTPSSLTASPGTFTLDYNDTVEGTASNQAGHVISSTTAAITGTVTVSFNYLILWVVTFK